VSHFPTAGRVAPNKKNAPVDSPAPANGMTLRDFPTPEACRRSRSEFVVIVRDPEHYCLAVSSFICSAMTRDSSARSCQCSGSLKCGTSGMERPFPRTDTLTQETATMYLLQTLIF